MIVTNQVTVGTSAPLLADVDPNRTGIQIQAPSGATLYIGGPGVTLGTGWPVPAGTSFVDTPGTNAYYGVLAVAATSYILSRNNS